MARLPRKLKKRFKRKAKEHGYDPKTIIFSKDQLNELAGLDKKLLTNNPSVTKQEK